MVQWFYFIPTHSMYLLHSLFKCVSFIRDLLLTIPVNHCLDMFSEGQAVKWRHLHRLVGEIGNPITEWVEKLGTPPQNG